MKPKVNDSPKPTQKQNASPIKSPCLATMQCFALGPKISQEHQPNQLGVGEGGKNATGVLPEIKKYICDLAQENVL